MWQLDQGDGGGVLNSAAGRCDGVGVQRLKAIWAARGGVPDAAVVPFYPERAAVSFHAKCS